MNRPRAANAEAGRDNFHFESYAGRASGVKVREAHRVSCFRNILNAAKGKITFLH